MVGVAHDGRRHGARPAEIVAVQRVEQPLDVLRRESSDVVAVVDVARRRPDQDQPFEALGLHVRREHADHRADRVPDVDDVLELERLDDVEHVAGVAVERRVPRRIEGRAVRAPVADVVEEHHAVLVGEFRPHVAPHVLVAPEAVAEDHRRTVVGAVDLRVAARDDVHLRSLGAGRSRPVEAGLQLVHLLGPGAHPELPVGGERLAHESTRLPAIARLVAGQQHRGVVVL
jgi:hypothetical protein